MSVDIQVACMISVRLCDPRLLSAFAICPCSSHLGAMNFMSIAVCMAIEMPMMP